MSLKSQIFHAIQAQNIDGLKEFAARQNLNFMASVPIPTPKDTPARNSVPTSPLCFAACHSTLEMVKALIDLGAKVTQPYVGFPSLLEMLRKEKIDPLKMEFLCKQALKEAREHYNLSFEENEHIDGKFKMMLDGRPTFLTAFDTRSFLKFAFLGDIEALNKNKVKAYSNIVDMKGPRDMNIVMIAAAGGNIETMKFLLTFLRAASDVFVTNHINPSSRRHIAEAAAIGGYTSVLQYLFTVHKDLLKEERFSIISRAIHFQHSDFVNHLISIDPSIIYETSFNVLGKTTLMRAAEQGNEIFFAMILACDQRERSKRLSLSLPERHPLLLTIRDIDSTVLHYAVNGGNVRIVTKILDSVPELLYAIRVTDNETALMNAAFQGKETCAEALLQRDKILKQKLLTMVSFENINVCMAAAMNGHVNVLKTIKAFDPKTFREMLFLQSTKGWNALHYAIKYGALESTHFLIEECDPDGTLLSSCTARNSNALQLSISSNFNIYKYLIEKKPDLLLKPGSDGTSTLMYAVRIFNNRIETDGTLRIRIIKDIFEREPGMIYLKDSLSKTVFDHLHETQVYLSVGKLDRTHFSIRSDFEKAQSAFKTIKETFVKLLSLLYNHFSSHISKKQPYALKIALYTEKTEQQLATEQQIEHQSTMLTAKERSVQINETRLRAQKKAVDMLRMRLLAMQEENKALQESSRERSVATSSASNLSALTPMVAVQNAQVSGLAMETVALSRTQTAMPTATPATNRKKV